MAQIRANRQNNKGGRGLWWEIKPQTTMCVLKKIKADIVFMWQKPSSEMRKLLGIEEATGYLLKAIFIRRARRQSWWKHPLIPYRNKAELQKQEDKKTRTCLVFQWLEFQKNGNRQAKTHGRKENPPFPHWNIKFTLWQKTRFQIYLIINQINK